MKLRTFLCAMFALTLSMGAVSCSDDDENNNVGGGPDPLLVSKAVYFMNQGNSYTMIPSTISCLDLSEGIVRDSVFMAANGVSVGNTLQGGVTLGDKLYLISYDSNILFALNRETLKIEKQMQINSPRALTTDGSRLYISTFDGYVQRLEPASFTIDARVEVGPNPEELAVSGGFLYVAISDGLNYLNGYANGCKVAKVNLKAMTKEKDIPVTVNPTKVTADVLGNVFVISAGNYYDVPAALQKITPDDVVTTLGSATLMTAVGDRLYVVDSQTDWDTYTTVNTYYMVDTKTNAITRDILSESVQFPTAIAVNPTDYHIFVASDPMGQYGTADYSAAGYVWEYDKDGHRVAQYRAGVHPVQLLFDVASH